MQMFQNKLYVFGGFVKTGKYYCSSMDRWNGSSWDTISYLRSGGIHLSDMYNNELYVAGQFDSIGGIECNSIAKFDGTNWHCLGYPYKDVDFTAIKNFQGKLYMAGQVNPQTSLANLSYWDGVQWIPWVGVTGTQYKYIAGMTVIDSMLYVYGRFDNIAGTNAKE